MENGFSNCCNALPFYYALIPFPQYSSPKICNVFHIGNNLEDSTHVQPSSPSALPQPSSPNHLPLQSPPSDHESPQHQPSTQRTRGRSDRRKQKEEYRPYQRQGRRKRNFLKENRNVLPIKIRQMLSFLTREKRSQEIIKGYVNRAGWESNFNEKKFYAFLKMKKQRIGNYVTLPVLKEFMGVQPQKVQLYSLPQQESYLHLVRILFAYYLNHLSPLCSLTSNRIRTPQKLQHIRVQRQLLTFLAAPHDY